MKNKSFNPIFQIKVQEFVDKMKSIQNSLLEYLEDESDDNDKYENFIKLVTSQEIINDKYEFKAFLQLISRIGNDHQRIPNFIYKLKLLLIHFKKYIEQYISNSDIFKIFHSNKRILLILIEEKILIFDEYIFSIITSHGYVIKNYCEYFQPEIKPFLTIKNIEKYKGKNNDLNNDKFIEKLKKEVEEDFYLKRQEGENDNYLCKLIRINAIEEFIIYTEKANIKLDNIIKKSIFETNHFLLENGDIKLIEYASFYGSNDIIKYMQMNGVKLTQDMWACAIHSGNAELINLLEENHALLIDKEEILRESIKCHHNEISNYIIDFLIKEEDLQNNIENRYDDNLYQYAVNYFNFNFFPKNIEYKNMFIYLCKFDYNLLVKLYLEEGNAYIDINTQIRIVII